MTITENMAVLARSATTVPTAASDPAPGANLIINGGMTVSQRGTSFVSPAHAENVIDRWQYHNSGGGAVTITQDTSGVFAAFGSDTCMKIDVTTADTSLAAADLYDIHTIIEAQDLQHLNYGDATAKATSLSFLFQSPKAGTHSGQLYQADAVRTLTFEFEVASANTPELITVNGLIGDTGGTINNDTGAGLFVGIALAGGTNRQVAAGTWTAGDDQMTANQQNLLDNTANNIYIGQVKLEVGSSATAFQHESYEDTRLKCLRYFEMLEWFGVSDNVATGTSAWATVCSASIFYSKKRVEPTFVSGSSDFKIVDQSNTVTMATATSFSSIALHTANLNLSHGTLPGGRGGIYIMTQSASASIAISAEL